MSLSRKEFLLSLVVSTTAFLTSCASSVDNEPVQPDKKPYLVSAKEIRTLSREELSRQVQRINPALGLFTRYGIRVYRVVYNTTLPDGKPVQASGALIVPTTAAAVPMVSQQHGTIQSDSDAPSYFGAGSDAYTGGALFSSLGFIMACPDYIGYGESKNQPHFYEHRESLATASLDMLRAAKEFIAQQKISWNEQLYLTGYSEGGYATMSLLKKIEEEFPDEFRVKGATLGAGAYHKSAFMKHIINERTHGIGSYNKLYLWALETYNSVYKNLNRPMSAYLKEPYAGQVAKGARQTSINVSLNQTFTDSFREGVNNGTDKAFLEAIADNDVYDWKPATPIQLYHGDADNLVFYFNSKDAYEAMKRRGADKVELITLKGRTHTSGLPEYILGTLNFFSQPVQ